MTAWFIALVLMELPPGVEAKTLMVDHSLACPAARSQSAFCDDPGVVLPTVDPNGPLDQVSFLGKKLGKTTCSCGLNQGFRFVFEITVISRDEGAEKAARRVVSSSVTRVVRSNAEP